ncbi:MAG: glutamate racemase [Candidatus Eisenbacteria bacterium]|nr:glutamate racemase [Candidatus Eisenbacteria bacterium]
MAASRDRGEPRDQRDLPIGVFDSGIGGLTVVREILRQLPGENVVYFGDSARVPYGGKSPETVTRFSIENTHFLARRGIKFLVVACNTASALALPVLQRRFDLPMIGVIDPGAREAVQRTRNGKIGVIGTTGTVGSRAYDRAIAEIAPDCSVEAAACPLFVPLAEEGWTEGEIPLGIARTYLDPLRGSGVDTVILGCTHYPLLRGVIADALGAEILLIDTAEVTVAEVRRRLEERGLLRPPGAGDGERHFFLSDVPVRFREIGGRFLGEPIDDLAWIEQSDIPWYER